MVSCSGGNPQFPPFVLGPPHHVWDRELLHRVLKTWWDPLGIVDLRKLMSQTFETMHPLKGLSEGTVPNSRVGMMAKSKD